MILMIDNYDSFTYNLVQYIGELDYKVVVARNDAITVEKIKRLKPSKIIISPGPCSPDQAGISLDIVNYFHQTIPILGVCLGHQTIAQAFGTKIVHARNVMHGKTSLIHHNQSGLFQNIPNPYKVMRYHSLVAQKESLADCFEITAWTEDKNGVKDEIMGISHKDLPISGVQFHPESISTEFGYDLLSNFLKL
ncbi:MAG: anthranilate synthase component II [Gammaproteobacteria bacterium]|jgi:anthranilate synthase component 2